MPSKEIPVSDAQAGMTTTRDILDGEGRILIYSGSRLSPVAIRRLPLWNVKTIFIEISGSSNDNSELKFDRSSANPNNPNIDTALISKLTLTVQNRFQDVEQDEFYKTYKTILLKYLVNNNTNGNSILPGFY